MSEPQREALPAATEPTAKPAYEPPRATFVPLQIEERLMVCGKLNWLNCDVDTKLS